MKRSPAWMLALAPVAGLLAAALPASAQWAPSPYYPAPGYPVQPAYYAPYGGGGAPAAAYPPEGALAGYNAPLAVYDPGVAPAAHYGCGDCGGAGCGGGGGAPSGLLQPGGNWGTLRRGLGDWALSNPSGIGRNHGQGIWDKHGPTGTAGCCTPRWWDIQAEFMYLTREDVSRRVDFTSQGVAGPIVLSTENLDFDQAPGFRLMGAVLLGPGTNLEGGYFGTFHWDTAAAVASANNDLYSAISNFGLIPDPNLPEVNQSNFQSIEYITELHNWELGVRRRWVSPNCRFHSSLFAGARYLVLNEDLRYFIGREDPVGTPNRVVGEVDTIVSTFNDLVGFQTGGDLLLCVIPRVKVGGYIKAGVYGVRAENRTTTDIIRPNDPAQNQSFVEFAGQEDVAFVGEGGFESIIEATERITLRAGYTLLYVDGIALAPENFDPDFRLAVRDLNVNDNGNVFYHGFYTGFEYTW